MKRIALLQSIAVFMLVCSINFLAQQVSTTNTTLIPHLIRFSGVVKDSFGHPITGIKGITFGLYREEEGGSPLWIETQNVAVDSRGTYEVLLGSEHSEGVPLDLFAAGQARWLGIQVNGLAAEQSRVLMVSVPYALKAADSDTLGGLPPSAFVLAPPSSPANGFGMAPLASSINSSQPTSNISGSGTLNFVPLWTPDGNTLGNSLMFQSGTGSSAKIGLNTTSPATTLDVKGAATVRGSFVLPPTGTATGSAGRNSQPQKLAASSYSSSTHSAVNQIFQWQAEPFANNTNTPSATLNLLFGSGSNAAGETGLRIGSNGLIAFANGQSFPGTGTVTSVGFNAPSSDFAISGSPVTSTGTLGLNWTVAPTNVNTPNAIVKRDSAGNFSANAVTAASFAGTSAAFTGNVSATDISSVNIANNNSGVFTNTQPNEYLLSQIGGINIGDEFHFVQGLQNVTDAIAGGVAVPSNASVHQVDGIAGYVINNASGNSGLGPNGVGGYFQIRATASGSASWATNSVTQDGSGLTNHWMIGDEKDINVSGSPSFLTYEIDTGAPWTGTIPRGVPFGFNCTTGAAWKILCLNPSGHALPLGIVISKGSVSGSGIQLDGQCTSGACPSQSIRMAGYDSSNVGHAMTIQTGYGAPTGNCNLGSLYSNTNATSASTVLYVCYPGNKWNAVSVA